MILQLVCRQVFHSKCYMTQRNREVQKRDRNKRQVNRLHKHAGAIPALFATQALRHHGSRVADSAGKEHGERKLHRSRPKRRIHFGRAKLRKEQAVDKSHDRVERHRHEHGKCHHEHILHIAVFLEFRRSVELIEYRVDHIGRQI